MNAAVVRLAHLLHLRQLRTLLGLLLGDLLFLHGLTLAFRFGGGRDGLGLVFSSDRGAQLHDLTSEV